MCLSRRAERRADQDRERTRDSSLLRNARTSYLLLRPEAGAAASALAVIGFGLRRVMFPSPSWLTYTVYVW